MAVAAAMSAVGLAALVSLPGIQAPELVGEKEVVPGAESLHVTLQSAERERLDPGDRVEYTIKVRNSGASDVPEAEVVHFLPTTMRYVGGTEGAEVDGGRVVWARPLAAGERTSLKLTGELTGVPEGASRPVSTVCLRSGTEGVLTSCASQEHEVRKRLSPLWTGVTAVGLLGILALAGGGIASHVRSRGSRPTPEEPADHVPGDNAPGETPDIGTSPGATVHRLDARR
ncbi:hypothetical protein [Nocardiopsis lambiniae]|uniref:DUF11 domain-containing protein n=1 Tax=Nocardiopsis lambiniae TaxID=3075539 RepID=A0ABU2M9C5_9ACTN|nr:hypothetical protein [Nocardiopsis sp. DSM 44743]MDT0328841.1 hypothetical protein [Nocardiopsis sp. DSM 44743]